MLQNLGFNQFIHAAYGFVYDGLAPGLGRKLGFDKGNRLLPAKAAIKLAQILAFCIAEAGDIVVFGLEMAFDFFDCDHFQIVIDGALHQIAQLQANTINNQQYQALGHGLPAATGTIYASCGGNQRGEFFTLFFTFAGLEHGRDIAVCAIRAGKQVVFCAGDIRPQGTFGFTAARILGDFILAGVVVENILVGRSHHGLQSIEHGRFARAGGAG